MSTLDDFVAKYDGKAVDYDKALGPQCVDLYRQYVKEVLGFPQSPAVQGAKDIWNSYLPDYFQRIENTPSGVPEKGDIVIFGSGTYGHVSIFLEGTTSKFTSFDQNYPSGTPCHKQGHTYSGVLGWLRPLIKEVGVPEWFTTLLQQSGLSLNKEGDFRSFWQKALDYDKKVGDLTAQVKNTNEMLSTKTAEVAKLTDSLEKLEADFDETQKQLTNKGSELSKATWEKEKLEIKVKTLEEDISSKDTQIDGLKIALAKCENESVDGISTLKLFKICIGRLLKWKE